MANKSKSKNILLGCFNRELKQILPKKRKTFISNILKNKLLLDNDLNDIINTISKKNNYGEDLNSYYHYHVNNEQEFNFIDNFLNATSFHHLHCSLLFETNNKILRSKDLLFIFFDKKNSYFIDVLPHNDWHKPVHLYNIILDNWNFLLKECGSARSAPFSTDEEIWKAIQNGVNSILKLKDEKCYTMLGSISTNGISNNIVNKYDKLLDMHEKEFKS